MAIIKLGAVTGFTPAFETMYNLGANQFVSQKDKESDGWIKQNMDYFYTVALAQYNKKKHTIDRNYNIIKGIITKEDFYENKEVMNFTDALIDNIDLPNYVQNYSIVNQPVNALVGELTKRPDVARAKAMDDDSRSEEMQYYTQIYQQLLEQEIKAKVSQELMAKGVDTSNIKEFNQQVEQLTMDKAKEYMTSYTSIAERWANLMLSALKVEFNFKEKSEEAFRDLIISNCGGFHIYENKTKTGFQIDVTNPKKIWELITSDKKYTRDAYAAGLIEEMELSEIIDRYDLPVDEIDHLREFAAQSFYPINQESNLLKGANRPTGAESVTYTP